MLLLSVTSKLILKKMNVKHPHKAERKERSMKRKRETANVQNTKGGVEIKRPPECEQSLI